MKSIGSHFYHSSFLPPHQSILRDPFRFLTTFNIALGKGVTLSPISEKMCPSSPMIEDVLYPYVVSMIVDAVSIEVSFFTDVTLDSLEPQHTEKLNG